MSPNSLPFNIQNGLSIALSLSFLNQIMSTQILKSRGASISDMLESEGTIYSEANSAPTVSL